MTRDVALRLLSGFFDALNASDATALAALLAEDVIHDMSDGRREIGAEKFRWHVAMRGRHFDETIADIVLMTDESGARAAAEFTRRGRYVATMEELPAAAGQSYSLNAGLFFELAGGRIVRITDPAGNGRPEQALAGGGR